MNALDTKNFKQKDAILVQDSPKMANTLGVDVITDLDWDRSLDVRDINRPNGPTRKFKLTNNPNVFAGILRDRLDSLD